MRDEYNSPITKAVHQLVSGICAYPGSLRIEEAETDACLVITIYPHTSDTRILVGKNGTVIKALEMLASVAGHKLGKKCSLSLENSFVGSPTSNGRTERKALDLDQLKRMVSEWTGMLFDGSVGMDFNAVGRDHMRVTLIPMVESPHNDAIIRAMDAVFYPWGKATECGVKIRPGE